MRARGDVERSGQVVEVREWHDREAPLLKGHPLSGTLLKQRGGANNLTPTPDDSFAGPSDFSRITMLDQARSHGGLKSR
jgi:hypothetical protein